MYIKSHNQGEFGLEGEVYFSLFDRNIKLMADDHEELDYPERCAEYLNSLPDETIDSLCMASIRYCTGIIKSTKSAKIKFQDNREVLKLINPIVLIVPEEKEEDPVVHLEFNCEWEPEKRMEWIVRKDGIQYVGPYDGNDPWGDYYKKEKGNYAE